MHGASTDNKIYHACCAGKLGKLKRMVGYGLDLFTGYNRPIAWAASKGHLETVKYLMSICPNVAKGLREAITSASMNGHLDIIKYSLDLGADIAVDENYPVTLAIQCSNLETVKYLINFGASKSKALEFAFYHGRVEMIDYLVSIGAHTEFTDLYVRKWFTDEFIDWHCVSKKIKFAFRSLFDLVFEQMKKYLLLKLLSKTKQIHKDLTPVIINKTFKPRSYSMYCEYYHKIKK